MVLNSHPDNGLKGVLSSFPELRQSKYQAEMLSKGTGYKQPEPFSFRRVGRTTSGWTRIIKGRTEWEMKGKQQPLIRDP